VSAIVSVLAPNIKTAEEYRSVLRRLGDISIDNLKYDYNVSVDQWRVSNSALMVYRAFYDKAFKHGKGLFLTVEEIKQELRGWKHIDVEETTKSMLDRRILKEVYMEWPPKQTPLCPFCGKPTAYPIKKKRFLFFTKITAWSCRNEICSVCGEQYVL